VRSASVTESLRIATRARAEFAQRDGRGTIWLTAMMLLMLMSAASTGQPADDAFAVAHRDAVNRQRRVIFNNDGNDPITKITRPSVQDMLEVRTTPLVDSHVDLLLHFVRAVWQLQSPDESRAGTSVDPRYLHQQPDAGVHEDGRGPADRDDPLRALGSKGAVARCGDRVSFRLASVTIRQPIPRIFTNKFLFVVIR
jgi:hypothetical protein